QLKAGGYGSYAGFAGGSASAPRAVQPEGRRRYVEIRRTPQAINAAGR
ncbi:MAG: hypothetical protein QOE82_1287, partial [Thermoanaerobaculia bacterium]|nr:hypothetical protein [Thermoanaerobaculia bacterium]